MQFSDKDCVEIDYMTNLIDYNDQFQSFCWKEGISEEQINSNGIILRLFVIIANKSIFCQIGFSWLLFMTVYCNEKKTKAEYY